MMLRKSLYLILPTLLLTGCVTPLTWEERLAIYQRKCMDFGFPPGTAEFASCVQQQDAQSIEQAEREADRQNRLNIERQRQWSEDQRLKRVLKSHKH